MNLLEKLQKPINDSLCDAMDDAMLNYSLMTDEERNKKKIEYEDRKCFCKTIDGKLACSKIKSGGLYKVDNNYQMTDESIISDKFDRWATGFDI